MFIAPRPPRGSGSPAGLGSLPSFGAIGSPLLSRIPSTTEVRSTDIAVSKVVSIIAFLVVLSAVAGYATWVLLPMDRSHLARNFGFGAGVVAFSLAFIASFKPQFSVWLAPLYAIAGGIFMGGLSLSFEQRFPGIAIQTVLVTGCVLLTMLVLYSAGWLRATPRLRLTVYVGTTGIALAYLVAIVFSLLGQPIVWLEEGSWGAVLWFGFVALTAALNLVLDFERIDRLRTQSQPAYIHWYVALGVMVTLVWLYISILRLIANLRR